MKSAVICKEENEIDMNGYVGVLVRCQNRTV